LLQQPRQAFWKMAMHRNYIPAEYELPHGQEPRSGRQWFAALGIVALIVAATLALVAASETASEVSMEVGK
jgi:hypothetical protein